MSRLLALLVMFSFLADDERTREGDIEQLDAKARKLVMRTDGGDVFRLTYDKEVSVSVAGHKAATEDLRKGQRIMGLVQHTTATSGNMLTIEIIKPIPDVTAGSLTISFQRVRLDKANLDIQFEIINRNKKFPAPTNTWLKLVSPTAAVDSKGNRLTVGQGSLLPDAIKPGASLKYHVGVEAPVESAEWIKLKLPNDREIKLWKGMWAESNKSP